MTIIAGIDEAGLGPYLGPLVVAGSAFRVPEGCTRGNIWHILSDAVSDRALKKELKPIVCDSKKLYSTCGIAGLERTIIAFASCLYGNRIEETKNDRLFLWRKLIGTKWLERAAALPWYRPETWEYEATEDSNLAQTFIENKTEPVWLAAHPVFARVFNSHIDGGLNKSEASMLYGGRIISDFAASFPDEEIHITIDKQGGRNFYHPWLMRIFPGAWIDIITEGAEESSYRLRRDGNNDIMISMRPKADDGDFCCALASITAKYLRERFMADLNGYFREFLPELKPTAGYPGDAKRFLAAIDEIITSEKIDRKLLVRVR